MTELRLHENAAKNFNSKVEELLSKVDPLRDEQNISETTFETDIITEFSITEDDIIGGITRQSFDNMTGNVNGIEFATVYSGFRIPEKDCEGFFKLVEDIQRTSVFRSALSHDFIQKNIINWLQKRLQHEVVDTFCNLLEEKAMEAVNTHEVWIPIANLYLEEEFSLGFVRFRTISPNILSNWFGNEGRNLRELQKLQGLAAATITLRAEQTYIVPKSLEWTEESLALLRVLHPSNALPHTICYCLPLGSENIASFRAFIGNDAHLISREEKFRPPFPTPWKISSHALSAIRGILVKMDKILSTPEQNKSEFQQKLLEALLVYSKNNITKDYAEKLMFILIALESMLNSNDTDPIQQNVADRMAFFLGTSANELRSIIRLVKTCYGLRSRFVHHGQSSISDLDSLSKFMELCHKFFLTLIIQHENYTSKDELLERIEVIKYS